MNKSWFHYVTVEPTLVLYMMAFMTTSVVEQDFFQYKACRVNHHYNHSICSNLSSFEDIQKKVQVTVSDFYYLNDILGQSGQIILVLFLGAWSDKRGRKIPLLIGLVGKLYYSVMIVVNTLTNWPVEYIVYTATLPMAFTGADVAIFAAVYSYLIDVSSEQQRTLRVTLLEVCYLATMPLGSALGKVLFPSLNRSYTIMFIINCSFLILSIIYSAIRLQWRTTETQRPLSEAKNILTDFFDFNHLLSTVKSITQKRANNGRINLIMLILMMALYTFQRDERTMAYLYVQLVFNWTFEQFSDFRTFTSALQVLTLLLAIPLMSRVFKWNDGVIIMIGAGAHSAARLFYALAQVNWVFYFGSVFAALGPIVAPVIRSMVSKLVAPSQKGKVLAILSVADNTIPLISGVCYSKIYNATIDNLPSAIFYFTMATQLGVFLLTLTIYCTAKSEQLIHKDMEKDKDFFE